MNLTQDDLDRIKLEKDSEKICDVCGFTMSETKRKKRIKERTFYTCSECGNRHRKRTTNEILRDLGLKE